MSPTFELLDSVRRTEITVRAKVVGADPIVDYRGRPRRPVSIKVLYAQATEDSPWYSTWKLGAANIRKDGSDGAMKDIDRNLIEGDVPEWVLKFVHAHMPAQTGHTEVK